MTDVHRGVRRQLSVVGDVFASENEPISADVFIAVVGYEPRARHIVTTRRIDATTRIGMAYTQQKDHDYRPNLDAIQGVGFDCSPVADEDFDAWFVTLLGSLAQGRQQLSLHLDISSMDRYRLSRALWLMGTFAGDTELEATFWYAPAMFPMGPVESPGPVAHLGPVSPPFAGWSRHPEYPCDVIIGLGLEGGSALTAIELLESSVVWPYVATGGDADYVDAVLAANEELLAQLGRPKARYYALDAPSRLVEEFNHLTARGELSRAVFVPLGPKIFALAALVSAYQSFARSSVWRISAGASGKGMPSEASGQAVGLRFRLQHPPAIAASEC